MKIEAESRYEAAQGKYAALLEEGRAEAKNIEAFEAQRRHNYEIKRAEVFQKLASSSKGMVISGKSGEALIASLVDVGDRKQ